MPPALIAGSLSIWALVIAGTDLRQLRVPNSFLLLAFVPALLSHIALGTGILGLGLPDALLGMAAGLALGLPGYAIRQFAAGDVKYLVVLGCLCGPPGIVAISLAAALVLGLMAVIALLRARIRKRKPERLPAAVAISSGFILLLVLTGRFDHGF